MSMTTEEMMLRFNDRLTYIEEQLKGQTIALSNLTQSCALIAEGLKRFMDDFYGTDDVEIPISPVRLPIAVEGNLIEKMKDPKFLKEFGDKFKKETESMIELEKELKDLKEEITKGIIGES